MEEKNLHKKTAKQLQKIILENLGGEFWDTNRRRFDPMAQFLAGACATEAEQVYDKLQSAEERVIKHLAKTLLPEEQSVPKPAHSIATFQPKIPKVTIDEKLQLYFKPYDLPRNAPRDAGIGFTPVFKTALLNAEVRFILADYDATNDYNLFKVTDFEPPHRVIADNNKSGGFCKRFWIGIEVFQPANSLEDVAFYFNLKEVGRKTSEELWRDEKVFYSAIDNASWYLAGKKLKTRKGFHTQQKTVDQPFSVDNQVKDRIALQYESQFIRISDDRPFDDFKTGAGHEDEIWKDIPEHLKNHPEALRALEEEMDDLTGEMMWLEVHLEFDINVSDLDKRMQCALNHFPVVNRKKEIKDDADTYFGKPSLQVIQLSSEKKFLGVKSVKDKISDEFFEYLPFARFKRDVQELSYTIRQSGVGRLDQYNFWERFTYILKVFGKEGAYQELVEKTGGELTVAEIHHLLHSELNKAQEKREQKLNSYYLFVNQGDHQYIRVVVEYWVTDGEKAEEIKPEEYLECYPLVAGIDRDAVRLVHSPSGWEDLENEDQQLLMLKSVMLSRNRIVTDADIHAWCRYKLGRKIDIEVGRGIEVDPRPQYGITRIVEVKVSSKSQFPAGWDNVCKELEGELNQLSASVLPIRVKTYVVK